MKTIYANALLSDEKILFWYTGQSPCLDWREFYKDFYYAGIDATEYEKQHTLRIARMGFEDNTENEDYNQVIFDVLAKEFYRQFAISEDSKGEKPYQPTADVVPKSEVERLEKEIKALLAFKDYFSDLYGHGLEIANWHENGELEYFDMFYESAVDEYEAELKKKYTEKQI